jgi:serine/threonine protein kinase
MVGRTILHYQFLEKLGAGGMGEIYKAQDTRLNRFVAIKVLTIGAVGDPDRRRRFIQEAQAASALNHPNIITIHDIVSEGGTDFMVMEFVSGKTLVDLIPKGGLRVSQVLKYSVQMADALQAAHNAGIVHRDLKPGNVMVTDSGLVKVLDFGLAKLTDRGPLTTLSGPNDATQTIAEAPLTVEGSIIGTVSYMSPEQAQGKKVDTRSDIFSYGVVLYEMVTGARAFEGDSTLTTLSAILRDEVRPVAELAPEAPPQLELVIQRCLRKSPDDRWQTMKDVQMALAALKHESDSGMLHRARLMEPPTHPSSVKNQSAKRKGVPGPVLAGALVGLIALIAIGGSAWWKHHKAPPPEQAAVEPAPEAEAAPVPAPPEPAPGDAAAAAPVVPPADEAMTNDHVIQMVEAKVSSNQIIAQIRASKATHFVMTPSEVIRLSKAGVQDNVIETMRDPKRAPSPPAASTAAPATPKSTPKQEPAPQQPAVVAQPQVPLPAPVSPPPVTPAKPPTPPSQPTSSQPGKTSPITAKIPDGTGFKITLADDIPENADKDQPLRFLVSEDVLVDGSVVIAKGASVTGAIADPGKKKFLVVGGKMTLKVTTVEGVDGHKLNVRALPNRRPEGAFRDVDTGKPKPKGVAATVGTEYYAYIDGDQTAAARK